MKKTEDSTVTVLKETSHSGFW